MASGGPLRPAGVPRIIISAGSLPRSDPSVSGSGVRMTPGEMALTRTPAGPNSAAHALVNVSTAPLVELYRALGMPRRAIHEPRLMIAPLPAAAITGAMAPVKKYGALTLTP